MRKLVAYTVFGVAAAFAGTALAADPVKFDYPVYKDYVPPYIPEVDYGLKGAFYLRGSIGGNIATAIRATKPLFTPDTFAIQDFGVGYSAGIGAGYETGDGLRFDVTVDYLENNGMAAVVPVGTVGPGGVVLDPGLYRLNLRSTIALANAYYDFDLDGRGGLSAAGGMFGYVGAGVGMAYSEMYTSEPGGVTGLTGSNISPAAAGMVGVGYDFGALVADVGYRGIYIHKLENPTAVHPYSIDHAMIHEIRGTLRYRFN